MTNTFDDYQPAWKIVKIRRTTKEAIQKQSVTVE